MKKRGKSTTAEERGRVQRDSENPDRWDEWGHAEYIEGDDLLAEKIWKKCLLLERGHINASLNISRLYLEQLDLKRSERVLRISLEAKGEHADILGVLGMVLSERKKWKKAEKCYRRSLDLDKTIITTYNNLSSLLIRKPGREEEAQELLLSLLDIDPECASTWMNIGIIYHLRGYYEEAVDAFYTAMKLDPDLPNLKLMFSDLLRLLGRESEARNLWWPDLGKAKRGLSEEELAHLAVTEDGMENALRVLLEDIEKNYGPPKRNWYYYDGSKREEEAGV